MRFTIKQMCLSVGSELPVTGGMQGDFQVPHSFGCLIMGST